MSEGCSVSQSISLWHCQNVLSTLVLTKVFGIHCNFYIVLPVRLEICRSAFFFVPRQKVCAPDLHRARNLSRPGYVGLENSVLRFLSLEILYVNLETTGLRDRR